MAFLLQDIFYVNKGLRGFFDRLTGQHRRIKKQNERECEQARLRDEKEKDALIFRQLGQCQGLQARIERLKKLGKNREQSLAADINQYHEITNKKRDIFENKQPERSYER